MLDSRFPLALAVIVGAALGAACSSSSDTSSPGSGGGAGAAQDAAAQDATDATSESASDAGGEAEAAADTGGACLAEGKYGKCTENPGCYCLKGATVYQFCTTTCQSTADCGDAASLPGATPGCYPTNPGSSQMICALICASDTDCPCGLVCTASGVGTTKLCAELQ